MISKMNKFVVDASALLALLNQENGYEQVEEILPQAIMSSVNLSEVIAVLTRIGMDDQEARAITHSLVSEFISFDTEQAEIAGSLSRQTKKFGLSLGDRACLSLAKITKLPIMTADKIWSKLKCDVDIIVIR